MVTLRLTQSDRNFYDTSMFRYASAGGTLRAQRLGEAAMAKGEQRGNREAKKPKKEKTKTIAAAPSTKGTVSSSTGSKK